MTASSWGFSMTLGVVEKMRKEASRRPASGDWLAWNRIPSNSGHWSPKKEKKRHSSVHTYQPRPMSSSGLRVPFSVYCLAISATASPIFLRTSFADSVVRQVTSFCRITSLCSRARVEKSSFASFVTGSFRVLVAILRNKTAENERVYAERNQ